MLNKKKQQPLISSFFGGRQPKRGSSEATTARSTSDLGSALVVVKTPEKDVHARAFRTLGFMNATRSNSGFDEPSSSADISVESPEINNFRSQSLRLVYLNRSQKLHGEVIDLTSLPTRDTRDTATFSSSIGSKTSSHNSSNNSNHSSSNTSSSDTSKKRSYLDVFESTKRKLPRSTSSFESERQLKNNDSGAVSVFLSEEQRKVIQLVVDQGKNIFYTGSAGTGKSVVLRELVTRLRRKFASLDVGVTAATGLAACNIGGQTLHRFLGIGRGDGSAEAIASRISKNRDAVRRWKSVKVLVIDEISMVDGQLFETLNAVGKKIRQSSNPFGGIQIVCTGDFFQLPPVARSGSQPNFCFLSSAWEETIKQTILLQEIFRQRGDPQLIAMLNAVRCGDVNSTEMTQFVNLARKVQYDDGIDPTELYPTRNEVKMANDLRLRRLATQSVIYRAIDDATNPSTVALLESLVCEKDLELKTGAQVMYLRNLDEEIVNGSMGTIMCFLRPRVWERVVAIYGDTHDVESAREIRLVSELAAKGTEIGSEEWEQVVQDIIPSRRSRVVDLFTAASLDKSGEVYPVVKFSITGGGTRTLLIQREEFSVEISGPKGGGGKVTRSQVPLVLSWALLIHKAQGQTIQRLRVDLTKVFESGQVYVALSRATSTDSLEVVNFSPDRIRVAPAVKEFYRNLEKAA